MSVGFGFVSICLSEWRCSPAGTVTVKSLQGLDREGQINRIRATARRNLENTLRITHFLRAHQIRLYRMSAQLIPLATHPATEGWAWWEDGELAPLMAEIGERVAETGVRISSHLPEVCVLTAADPDKLQWAHRYLAYHRRLFEGMGLDHRAKILLHLGGAGGNRARALERAAATIRSLDPWARERLCLENDDKTFSAAEVLALCQEVKAPMVFDYHHHVCRNDGEDFRELLPHIFATWHDRPPKIHLSSPRSERQPRAHADYVDPDFIRPLVAYARTLGDFDIMVEAKQKDLAMFRLQEDLAGLLD